MTGAVPAGQGATELADRLLAEGNGLEDRGDHAAALRCYRAAIEANPRYPRAHLNEGNVLRLLGQSDAAADAFSRAIALDPAYAHAHFNLGTLLATTGDREGAKAALHQALRLSPAIAAKVLDAESYLLWTEALSGELDVEASAREHLRVGAALAASGPPAFRAWDNAPIADRKLRIGYVSGDITMHPVALFLRPLLERHDRKSFEIHCYSNTGEADPVADTFRASADGWHEIHDVPDNLAAQAIRADGIDILVDLSGHTERNRLALFARHAAPVQATWLGYLATSGLAAMDYRICDSFTDPPGATEHRHSERLVRLPHSQWCYQPWADVPPSLVTTNGGRPTVFGSVNQYAKIGELCLDLWAEIMARVPEASIVVFDVRSDRDRRSLVERLARRGIAESRIGVRNRLTPVDYYRAMAQIDVALDTHPYNGATTTLDALWMGVPVVALRGERGMSRSTYSILSTLALPELIARTREDYVALNVALARDAAWRGRLRATLRGRLAASPLTDMPRFASDIESAYRRMWSAWCAARAGRPSG